MIIEVARRQVYGVDRLYVVDHAIGRTLRKLTDSVTLCDRQVEALVALGLRVVEVAVRPDGSTVAIQEFGR